MSTPSSRWIIVRQSSFKIASPSTEPMQQVDQTQVSTIVTTVNEHHRSLFNMRRRQGKDSQHGSDQRICTKENCLTCCKKFTAFMFSRVGLFCVMIGYVAFGGLLFQALEAGNERNMRHIMDLELNSTLNKLWIEILRVNSFPFKEKKSNFSANAMHELEQFESTVIRQVQQGFDGRTKDADNDWNYFGAVLYAVTLISTIGYGHITTKTTQGKIATILYSAFGVPLMMLFVANIGSTMAKLFAFVFTRITMIFCCRMSAKKKRALAAKNRQKSFEKSMPITTNMSLEEKLPIPTKMIETSGEEKIVIEHEEKVEPSSSSSTTSRPDIRSVPANVRLNMLTGVTKVSHSSSLTSSVSSVPDRSKDAIVRINELIRQSSVQEFHENDNFEPEKRRRSAEFSPIEYYINETNKLTDNLDHSTGMKSSASVENLRTDENRNRKTEEVVVEPETTSKVTKKILKRSKSESMQDHRTNETTSADDQRSLTKPTRRRFFSRRQNKLKKQTAMDESTVSAPLQEETNRNTETLHRKSQSFHERSQRSLPPPPDYEQSTTKETGPVTNTVTWKTDDQLYSVKPTFDLPGPDIEIDEEEDEDDDEDEEMSVPLLVTVFVIPLYLTLGAILFNIWENWGFLNSFYFCFITLTTIGFGDFVPGSALNAKAEKEKLISAALYILLGLVLIAMCVNLMKEQLSQKVKRVASKLGKF